MGPRFELSIIPEVPSFMETYTRRQSHASYSTANAPASHPSISELTAAAALAASKGPAQQRPDPLHEMEAKGSQGSPTVDNKSPKGKQSETWPQSNQYKVCQCICNTKVLKMVYFLNVQCPIPNSLIFCKQFSPNTGCYRRFSLMWQGESGKIKAITSHLQTIMVPKRSVKAQIFLSRILFSTTNAWMSPKLRAKAIELK